MAFVKPIPVFMDKTTKLSVRRCFAAVACSLSLLAAASCSSDDDAPQPPHHDDNPEVTYKGNVAYSDGLVFNGNELGNGTQNFHLTGDVTLEKGTYLLKGGYMSMRVRVSGSLREQ